MTQLSVKVQPAWKRSQRRRKWRGIVVRTAWLALGCGLMALSAASVVLGILWLATR